MFKTLKGYYHRWTDERDLYFNSGAEDIVATNLYTLVQVSFAAVVLTAMFIFMTPFIIESWVPTPAHLILVPVMAVYCLVAIYLKSQRCNNKYLVYGLCFGFVATLFVLIIFIDVYQAAESPACFMPIMLIVVPALFNFRFRYIYTELVLFEVGYIAILYQYKIPAMARNDCFNSLVSLIISLVMADIIQRLRAENYLARCRYKKQSMTDGLTGIRNKTNSEQAVQSYLELRPEQEPCALLMMDVDDFKKINDNLGHQVGDEVLRSVGVLLKRSFRDTDVLGRVGGDEFMVLMTNLSSAETVHRKCQKLFNGLQDLSEKFEYRLTCSIGVALLGGNAIRYEQFFQVADDALYEAKGGGKSRVAMHQVYENVPLNRGKPVMLIADDNEMNRAILRVALEDEYEIVEAETGTGVLEQVGRNRERLDIILLDLMMPELDGYKILKYLKNRARLAQIPVVVITADEKSEREVLELGAADMIAKPFDAEVVQLRVRNALRHSTWEDGTQPTAAEIPQQPTEAAEKIAEPIERPMANEA